MRKEVYLKKFWELYQEDLDAETSEKRYRQGRKMIIDYQRKLEKEGWKLLPIEGGLCFTGLVNHLLFFQRSLRWSIMAMDGQSGREVSGSCKTND